MTDPVIPVDDLSFGSLYMELAATESPGTREQWIHVLPSGTFFGKDRRGPWKLTNAAAVIKASQRYAGSNQIPIDYEHQIIKAEKNGLPAPAAGWIDGLEARANGIWGHVVWTARAAAYIANREYRYFSPVFNHARDGSVTQIVFGAITNTPAISELVAVARSEVTNMKDMQPLPLPENFLSNIRTLLGLPETSTPEEILAAVKALTTTAMAANAADPDPTRFVPIGVLEDTVKEVNRLNKGIARTDAIAHVEHQIQAGNLPPALKSWGVALCSVNKTAFDAFVERTGGVFNALFEPQLGGRMYRAAASANHSSLDDNQRTVCQRMGLSEEDFLKARNFNAMGEY